MNYSHLPALPPLLCRAVAKATGIAGVVEAEILGHQGETVILRMEVRPDAELLAAIGREVAAQAYVAGAPQPLREFVVNPADAAPPA